MLFIDSYLEYIAISLLVLGITGISLSRLRRRFATLVVVLFVLFVLGFHYTYWNSLGKPQPIYQTIARILPPPERVIIIAFKLDEANKRIYLWVERPGSTMPRYYVYEWSTDMANDLIEAEADALQLYGNSNGKIEMIGTPSLETRDNPVIHALPHPDEPEDKLIIIPETLIFPR